MTFYDNVDNVPLLPGTRQKLFHLLIFSRLIIRHLADDANSVTTSGFFPLDLSFFGVV